MHSRLHRERHHREESLAHCERAAISVEEALKAFEPGYDISQLHGELRIYEAEALSRIRGIEERLEDRMGGGGR